jgi:catechol 2,3-dioxygenase-like lactoylglutathione lyase family enzyme
MNNEDPLFRKVGAVILLVSDMKQSIIFYRDALKLDLKSESDEWTEFFNSGTVIALHPINKRKKDQKSANTVSPGTSNVLVGFMVNDLDLVVNKLRAKNVKFFKEPKEEPFGKHTIIQDPDGHLLSIAQIESKSTEGFDLFGLIGAE